jgi:hypothetical protein
VVQDTLFEYCKSTLSPYSRLAVNSMENSEWSSYAYHLYMPRRLPDEEETLETNAFVRLLEEFLKGEKYDSSELLLHSLRLWQQNWTSETLVKLFSSDGYFLAIIDRLRNQT